VTKKQWEKFLNTVYSSLDTDYDISEAVYDWLLGSLSERQVQLIWLASLTMHLIKFMLPRQKRILGFCIRSMRGPISLGDSAKAQQDMADMLTLLDNGQLQLSREEQQAHYALYSYFMGKPYCADYVFAWRLVARTYARWEDIEKVYKDRNETIADIVGDPFDKCEPFRAEWRTRDVMAMAKAAEDDYDHGMLACENLKVLADAAEEAGCTNETILQHLRKPGLHVYGCWAVESIMGRK